MTQWRFRGFATHDFREWDADGYHYLHYTVHKGDEKVREATCRMKLDKYRGEHTAFDWETTERWDAENERSA